MKAAPAFTLITGASQGLGLALAEACARRGRDLALVALPDSGLPEAAGRLAERYGVRVEHLELDLTARDGVERLLAWLARRRIAVDTLINNAGISHHGPFREAPPELLRSLLELNVVATVRLTRLLLPELERRPGARILNVASLAAFQAMPHKAVYAPSKSFVLNFTLSLREELRGSGVRVCALCPGGMPTNPQVRALIRSLGSLDRRSCQEPAEVAEFALRRLERGRAVIVPGALNRAARLLIGLVPRSVTMAFVRRRLRGSG